MSLFFNIIASCKPSESYQDFFLIGGQSNTGTNTTPVSDQTPTGRVSYGSMPAELKGVQTFKVWDGTEFANFLHTVNYQYGWINHFLKGVSDSGRTVCFYKWGQGGNQLTPNNDPYTSYPRETLKTNGLAAWSRFKTINPNPRIIFLWSQGYTDGLILDNAKNYGAYEVSNPEHATGGTLGAWFQEVRDHFGEPEMKIIYNTVSNNATGSTYRAEMKLSQEYVETLSPNNILVNADDLQFSDTAHYGATGVVGLSDRYLEKYSSI